MTENTVDYIIRVLRDDSELKKQLQSTEKDITKLNAHERAEVKSTLQAKMTSLKTYAKIAKKNPGDTEAIQKIKDEAKLISDAFGAMRELNPTEEWTKSGKAFAQTFTDMYKQFSDVAKIIEPLKSLVKDLGNSFGNLGFNIAPTVDMSNVTKQTNAAADGVARVAQEFTILGEQAGKATVKTNKSIGDMEKHLSSIDALFDKGYKIKFDTNLEDQFYTIDEEIAKLERDIGKLEKKFDRMPASDKDFDATRDSLVQKYAKQSELYRKLELIDEQYVSKHSKKDSLLRFNDINPKNIINEAKGKIVNLIDDAKLQLRDISNSTKTAQDGINIPLKLPTQTDLVNTINEYIAGINESKAIDSIKIEVDDPTNVIEDKITRGYKGNPGDDDTNTTKLVEKTEKRFEAVREVIDRKQGEILDNTKTWRKDMVEQLKFKNGDFEFNFGGDLFQSLQDYLNEQGNELKFVIDQDTIKEQLKTVIENSGLTVGGLGNVGTAVVDANVIAQAVREGMQSAITGQPLSSFDADSKTDMLKDTAESVADIVNSTDKYVKTITEKTINSERVIEELKHFADASTKKGVGRQNVAKWLTNKGINIDAINKDASDEAIREMLNKALMTKDKFGYAQGALFADSLSDLKQFGITGGKQETDVQNLKREIVEMLNRMGINQEYWQESQRRYHSYDSYENAAKYGRPIATLGKVRKPLYANSMKNFTDDGYKRLTDGKYIGNLDSLISFMKDLQSEHLSKANQEIELAQQKALKLKEEFTTLDNEAETAKKRLDELTAEHKRLSEIPDDKLSPKDISDRIKVKKELDDASKQYAWNRRDFKDKKNEYLRLVNYTDKEGIKHSGLIEQMNQRRSAQKSVYDEAKKQITSFKDSILGLGENPSEEAINTLEQVARNFFEQSGKMMQKLFSHYGDMDTFQGRVTLQNGRVADISSPYDFLSIKDDEVANVDVYNDILMKKWEKSKSVKKGIPQDLEKPNYYVTRPKPPIDIENERIESQNFVPIDEKKTTDLTNSINATESRIKQLSEENKNITREVEQLNNEIQTKEQEAERLSEIINSLSEEEKQKLTKEAEKVQKTLTDKQNKQEIEQRNLDKIDADIRNTESAITFLQNPITSEEFDTKYNDLEHRIYEISQRNPNLEQSRESAYKAYEEALLNHEATKKAYNDYIDKLANEATAEAIEAKKQKNADGLSEIETISKATNISESEVIKNLTSQLEEKFRRDFDRSGREDIAKLRKAETNARIAYSNLRGTGAKDVYDRIVGQMEGNDQLIVQLEQERNSLTMEAMQTERDASLQQKQTALQELKYQRKLAESRLKRAQSTEQSSADVLANNAILQQSKTQKELNSLRLKRDSLSGRGEEASTALASEQTSKERLELQSQYNQLKTQERNLQREIKQLEDGDTKNTKNTELEATIQKLSELEAKIIALGGAVNRVSQQEYTEEQKKGDALRQAEEIQNKLIEAKAQQRAYRYEVEKIVKLEENMRHGGLTSSIGRQYVNKFKSGARSDFRGSEYYHNIRNQKKETLNLELDNFASEQAKDIVTQIQKKKDDIADQVVQKVLGKKNIDLKAIRKTAIDEYVKTNDYKKVVADAGAVRASKQADADNTFNREVNEYINNLVVNEISKRVTSTDVDKRAKEQNISIEDARKAIEQEIRRDVEQQYKEEIRQFRGQANIRKQEAYASAKIEEQKTRSNAREHVGQVVVDKEIEKIAKDKASEIKRKQEAAVKDFETSTEYANMHEAALNNVKQKQHDLWDALDKEMNSLVDEYIKAIKSDKGKVKITDDRFRSVFDNFIANSQYSLSGQGEVDLKQYILDELKKEKAIAKGESADGGKDKQEYIKGLPQLIAHLEKSLAEALAYGGFEREELANSDLLQEIIDKTAKLKSDEQELANKEQELFSAIDELMNALKQNKDTEPYKVRVKELKAEVREKEELIDREESEIENAKEQISLRAEERAASSKSLSDRLAKTEQRLTTAKENLANVKREIADLEKTARDTEAQHGQDSPEAERARLNLLYKQRAQRTLEKHISRDEKKVQRWSGKVAATDAVVETSGHSTSTRGGIFDGVIAEMKEIAHSMGGGTIDVDNSDIATETTLRAIFEMLSGGGQASADLDAEKARGKTERDARRKEEQDRVIAESRKQQAESNVPQTESKKKSKTAQAKAKLNTEGQTKFNAIQTEGRKVYSELINSDEKTIIQKIKDKAKQFKGLTEGTEEYLKAQYELSNMVFAYTNKLQTSGVTSKTKKNGQKYLDYKDVVERPEIKKLGDIKSLMLPSKNAIADGLVKLGFGAQLSRNKKKSDDINNLDDEVLIKKFKHLMQLLSENKATETQKTELNQIIDLLKGKGLIKDDAEQVATETSDDIKTESIADDDSYKKAVEIVRSAIGDFDMRSSNVKKAEQYNTLGQEVEDAGNVIYKNLENATREEKSLFEKLIKLRDVASKISSQQVIDKPIDIPKVEDVKPEIEEDDVDEVVDPQAKEQARQMLQSMISGLESLENRITELEGMDTPEAQTEKESLQKEIPAFKEGIKNLSNMLGDERSDEESQAVVDAINNVGEQVVSNKDIDDTSPRINEGQSTERSAPVQGGIIGIMRSELAKENTLQKVLTAIGEIAKKNAMVGAGKANSAQDLLEQFRRMLESDMWESRERVAYVDLATGTMSNSITGDDKSISAERLKILRDAYKDVMDLDAQVHTHANEDDPYFSQDDLKLFASDFADGITKQILLSKNNMTVLDMTGVKDVNGLLDALAKTEHNFEALATTAEKFGAKYVNRAFSDLTPQGLVKMLGIKGIESKYTETETRESARKGVLAEDAKEAADILQESTGRATKKTVERYGLELETFIEKTDTKGNKTWSSQINNKFKKLMESTRSDIDSHNLDEEFGVGTKAATALNDYREKYQQLIDLSDKFNNSTSEAEKAGLQQQINELLPIFNKAQKELVELIARKEQFLRVGEKLDVVLNQDSIGKGSLENIATKEFFGDGLEAGQNIATAGTQSTKNGRQLLVDVLDHGTISRYGIEVDEVTGQVRKLAIAEGDLANAFQNVNRAMKFDKTVQASIAVGSDENQMQQFLQAASSPAWDTYKTSLLDMQNYTAELWNTMKAGGSASQEQLDYLMALSERVISLGKNVQKTSVDFKNFWDQNPENVFSIDKISYNLDNRDEKVRAELEKQAKTRASANNSEYAFSSFDNDTLQFTLTDVEGKISKVTYQWNELYNQIAVVSDKSTSALDPMVAKINRYDEALQQAVKDGYLMTEDSNFDGFYKAQDSIKFLIDGIEKGYETFDTVKEKLAELRQEALRYGEAAKKTITKNKRLYTGTNEINSVNRQRDKIIDAFGGAENFKNNDIKLIKDYRDAYKNLDDTYKRFAKNRTLYDSENQEQLRQQAIGVQRIGKKLIASMTQAEKLAQLVEQSGSYIDGKGIEHELGGTKNNLSQEEVQNLDATMRSYAQTVFGANLENVKVNKTTGQLIGTLRLSKDTVADVVVQYNAATGALYAYNKQERESLTGFPAFMKGMKAKMASIMQYIGSITSIYRVWGELKRGVQYIREIDSALTELKKVTDETEKTYDNFLDTAAKTADKVGSTIKEVVSSTADWARLGYSLEDAHQLAESTSILLNVSEFQSIEDATSALTSTLQAFGYTADQSMDVVDVLNEVGNNFAISSDGIATALQDSASSLMAANNSYEEAVALIAAANRVVQDPNSVGAALRTISLRLRGTSATELEEAGEDTDGAIASKSKLRSKIKGLSGVDILTDTGAYKSTYEILLEISKVWEGMSDINQAALLEILAGKTRSNTAAAILSNTKDLEEAYVQALEAEGSALEENEKYLDSIQGKIDLFTNAVQTMWQNTLDSEVIKGFIEFGTVLIKIIDKIGLIQSLLIALSSYSMIKHKMGPITFFKELIGLIPRAKTAIQTWVQAMQTQEAATIAGIGTKTADTAATKENTKANNENAASSVASGKAEDKNTADRVENVGATVADTNVTKSNTKANNENATSEQWEQISMFDDVDEVVDAGADAVSAGATAGAAAGGSTAGAFTGLAAAVPYILVAIGVIAGLVVVFNLVTDSVEELRDELKEAQTEYEATKTEIESLNSELETTREKIAELEAQPSLSLTDQDELNRLKQQNEQLERSIKLQEMLLKQQETAITTAAEEYISASWDGSKWYDKAYTVDAEGVISADKWHTAGVDTTYALDTAISKYKDYKTAEQDRYNILTNWDEYEKKIKDGTVDYETYQKAFSAVYGHQDDSVTKDSYLGSTFFEEYLSNIWSDEDGTDYLYNKLLENKDGFSNEMVNIAEGINEVLNDPQYANLTYGMSDEIDDFLNEYNTYVYKWKQAQGEYVKSDAISSLFDDTSTEEMQSLGKELQEIADNEIWSDANKEVAIRDKISDALNSNSDAYEQLRIAQEELGVTAQDISDYFLLETGTFDSSTIEGVTKQYAEALNVMEELKNMGSDKTFTIREETFNWDEFFTANDEGEFEARADKFAEILKGMDEDCRETFMSLAESVKNGELTWEQAMKSFSHSGSLAGLKVIETQIIELNNTQFKNIKDEISGVIDTFSEFSAALEDVASSMELLNTAQTQMNNSDRISVKTALEIMQSTDQWNEILEIENGNIRLVGNATEILVEDKLALIKANLQNALATVTEQLAMVDGTIASNDMAVTMEESTNQAVRKLAGSMAYLTKMMEAYTRIANGEQVNIDDFIKEAQGAQAQAEADLNWKVNAANKIGKSGLEQRKAEIEAQLEMLEGIDTASEFKNYYDYDKTPGDKDDSEGSTSDKSDKFKEEMEYWENRIGANQARYEQLQNEIDLLESQGKKAGTEYYKEQIELEEQRLDLLESQKAAALNFLGTFEEGSDEWFR